MSQFFSWFLATLLVALCFPHGLLAQPSAEYEAHIKRGVELRTAGNNAEAVAEFERAVELTPTPRARAQLALAHQALGHWLEAERGLRDALAVEDAWVARYRASLEQALAVVRGHLGWLTVEAEPSSATLRVAEQPAPVGKPVRVVAGEVPIEVSAEGHKRVVRSVPVAAEATVREAVELEPEVVAVEEQPKVLTVAAPAPPQRDARDLPERPVLRNVMFVSSGVLLAGGLAAWRVREHHVDIWNDDDRCLTGSQTRSEQCGDHQRAARIALSAEIIAFTGSAAALGAGIWMLVAPRRKSPVAILPSYGPGVSCRVQF